MYLGSQSESHYKIDRYIVEEQLDVRVLGVICTSLLTGRHLLVNKMDKNSQYTNIKIMTI